MIAWCFVVLPLCQSEIVLTGKVTDATTHLPIQGAAVTFCCERVNAMTNADGVYTVRVRPDGPVLKLTVSKRGYAGAGGSFSEERDLEMKPGAHVSGHIVDRDSGKPLPGRYRANVGDSSEPVELDFGQTRTLDLYVK